MSTPKMLKYVLHGRNPEEELPMWQHHTRWWLIGGLAVLLLVLLAGVSARAQYPPGYNIGVKQFGGLRSNPSPYYIPTPTGRGGIGSYGPYGRPIFIPERSNPSPYYIPAPTGRGGIGSYGPYGRPIFIPEVGRR